MRGVSAWKVREVEKGPWVAAMGWARVAFSDSVTALCGILLPGNSYPNSDPGWATGATGHMLSPGTTPVEEPSRQPWQNSETYKVSRKLWSSGFSGQEGCGRRNLHETRARQATSCLSPQTWAPPDLCDTFALAWSGFWGFLPGNWATWASRSKLCDISL